MHTAKELLNYAQHLNILYVEDDERLREETVSLFEPFFKEIDTACDGEEGLKKYNDKQFDIVITDINMPKMNGIEMISNIKEIDPEQKIIAISAHNESDILVQLIKAGVNSFILKPIIQSEVIEALYSISRDSYTQIFNIELVNELNEKNEELEKQLKKKEI
jgi:YesN/AraC family two-component response regulator